MPVAVPRYTLDDLDSFPDDGRKYELLDGVLHVTPAPAPLHEVVVSRLMHALMVYMHPSGLARVFPRGAVQVAPNNHLEPDVIVIPASEPSGGIGPETKWTAFHHWWLAVEVSGRGSRAYDRDHKTPAYLSLGVREVWRVDLKDRFVEIASRGAPVPRRVFGRLIWDPPGMSSPLEVEVASLFQR
jgi:Uma2 family endonuclease